MNRLFWLVCFTVIGLILLAGCGDRSSAEMTDWDPTDYETVNTLDGVTMTVKEGTLTSTGLTIVYENTSDKNYTYGDPFLLEKKMKDSWYQVPIVLKDGYGFNDIGYDLAASDMSEWPVDWEWLYGSLDTGEYRIVKDILDVRIPGDYDTHHLAVEFSID